MRKIICIFLFSFFFIATSNVHALALPSSVIVEDTESEEISPTRRPTTRPSPRVTQGTTSTNPARNEIQTFRERRQAAKENFLEQRERFQEKMTAIKDTRKQAILERVDERINSFNERHTEIMDSYVTKMTEVLEKIKTKRDAITGEGEAVTAIDTAITEAEDAIAAAKEAVALQIEKEYVVEFTSETQLKTASTKVHTEFKKDIKAVDVIVRKAHKEVLEAAQALGKVQRASSQSSDSMAGPDAMSEDESSSEAKVTPKL